MSSALPQIAAIEKLQHREQTPFRVGDTVKVHFRILEGDKERVQIFQGVVIRKKNGSLRSSFAVRKVTFGVGVERIFPTHSPRIEKIEVIASGHVRRARLYYLRDLQGKAARLRERKQARGN